MRQFVSYAALDDLGRVVWRGDAIERRDWPRRCDLGCLDVLYNGINAIVILGLVGGAVLLVLLEERATSHGTDRGPNGLRRGAFVGHC